MVFTSLIDAPPRPKQAGKERMPSGPSPDEYWSLGLEPYNPDAIVGAKGLKIWREMRRRDPVVALGLKHLEYSRLAKGHHIDPGEGPRAAELADFVHFVLGNIRGTTKDLLRDLLDGLPMGFAIVEKVPVIYDGGPWSGRWGFSHFSSKWQESIDFRIGRYGELEGIVHTGGIQRTVFEGAELGRFIVYVPNRLKGNWYGESILRPAYRAYTIKDHLARYLAVHMEKFGSGTIRRKVGHSAGVLYGSDKMATIQSDLEKHHGAMAYTIEHDGELDLLFPPPGVGEGLIAAIDHCNAEILRALGIPQTMFSGTGTGGEGGSLALSQTHAQNFAQMIDRIGRSLEDTIDEQVIRPLIEWNWPNIEPDELPSFRFAPYQEEDGKEKLDRLLLASRLGVPLLRSDVYEAAGAEVPGEHVDPEKDLIRMGSSESPIYKYHIDSGVVTANQVLEQIGKPPVPDGDLLIQEWQRKHGVEVMRPGAGGGGLELSEGAARFAEASEWVTGYLERFGREHFAEIDRVNEEIVSQAVREMADATSEIREQAAKAIEETVDDSADTR